jgi:transcriptional regulator of arginine metabolism
MKQRRQECILNLIRKQQIKTHEQLLLKLQEQGFAVTQATISRDINELGIVKVPVASGGSVYAEPIIAPRESDRSLSQFSDSVIGIDCALHTIIVKTFPGMASAVAASIDVLLENEIMGSIAGDDTVLLIAADVQKASALTEHIRNLFRGKEDKNADSSIHS